MSTKSTRRELFWNIAGGLGGAATLSMLMPGGGLLLLEVENSTLDDDYARAQGIGALVVEQAWARPWMRKLPRLGMHGISVGGVTVYPMAPWLAAQARCKAASCRGTSSKRTATAAAGHESAPRQPRT